MLNDLLIIFRKHVSHFYTQVSELLNVSVRAEFLQKVFENHPQVSIFSLNKSSWSSSNAHPNYSGNAGSNPPPPRPVQPPGLNKQLTSVMGSIHPPPPPPPPEESYYGRYQPPPPPPADNYGYPPYQPPQPQFSRGNGLLGEAPMPPVGSYGNYNTYPPQKFGANSGPPPHRGGGIPSLMSMPVPVPKPPQQRTLAYLGANEPPPANPLFKHLGNGEGLNF
jgi:hypothetical protein